ncbi:hypothetical protein LIS82_24825 [Cytobacillus solani]|uniref:hypothetical protein n=1 Tax=Cytobacillus solani TaxID=1637975 RepID=UPI0006F2AD00|nr:hypothetical protein [Cytobacillus solani]USK54725.1 hypothetical protein LIS82_24825 [Cytobacillus solani]
MNEEKIESMLSQLITMVGTMHSDQLEMKQDQQEMKQDIQGIKQDYQEMKQDMQEMKRDQQEMKQDMQEMKQDQQGLHFKIEKMETKSEERHQEILARFKVLENDQDFIWEKTARNERDLANIKRQLS